MMKISMIMNNRTWPRVYRYLSWCPESCLQLHYPKHAVMKVALHVYANTSCFMVHVFLLRLCLDILGKI